MGFSKKKYSKVVRSTPMDLNRVSQAQDPIQQQSLSTMKAGMSQSNTMTGAKVVNYGTYNSTDQPLIGKMTSAQLNAANANPDLRKKLRVDRVRKMTMGNSASLASVEDPAQPDWMKVKSLREIETIRETKKRDILNALIGVEGEGSCPTVNVMPGQLTFLDPVTVINDTNQTQLYSIKIIDPDEDILGGFGASELQLVQDGAELNHWVARNKVSRPPSFNAIRRCGDI